MLWFNLALIFPTLGIPGLFEFRTVYIMTPFVAAMLGLGISQAPIRRKSCEAGFSPSIAASMRQPAPSA